MKVLHFHQGDGYGGIQVMLETLAQYRHLLPEIDSEFAVCFERLFYERLTAAGVPVHSLGPVKSRFPWQILRARHRLRKLIQREKYDLVILHSTWALALFGSMSQRQSPRLVFWMHNNATAASQRHFLEKMAARCRPDLVICNSRFTASSLSRQFRDRPPSTVLPCPVPAREVAPTAGAEVRRELGLSEDTCVIVQCSRIEQWKGLALHIKALGLLREETGWASLIVGAAQRPPQRQFLAELQSLTSSLGIADRVHFLGHREDVHRLLAGADICCHPNLEPEPFGLSFVEALGAGLPLVSVDHGGVTDIANSACARLLPPPASAADLAQVLRELIADPLLRERMSVRARACAERFLPENILPQLVPLFREVLSRRSAS